MKQYSFSDRINSFALRLPAWSVQHSSLLLGGICCLSFFLKIFVWICTPVVSRDSTLYLQMIQLMHETGSYTDVLKVFASSYWIPPLHVSLVSSVMYCGLCAEHAGVLINIVFASLLVPVGYGIVYSVTENKKIALVAALFFAVHPGICDLSIQVQREIIYLFFVGCALFLFFSGVRKKQWYSLCGTGGALALGSLTRYETAELTLLFLIAVFVLAAARRISWKFAISSISGMVTSFVVVFMLFLYLTGNIVFIKRLGNYYNIKYKNVTTYFAGYGRQ